MAKSKNKPTILVTGATGKQGGAVLRKLRERNFPVRALTRDPDAPEARRLVGHGTEVFRGDLDDPASLLRAMDGVDGVFSVQSNERGADAETQQGLNVVDAAKRLRISQFVYSSVASADQKTGIPHFESKFRVEEHLRTSGLRFAILRPAFFMENWLGMREQIEGGTLPFPLDAATPLQMIAVDDIGAFAAMAFERPGHWQGKAVELAGDTQAMTDVVQALSRITGHEVRYQQVPFDAFEQQAGHDLTVMFRWLNEVGYNVDVGPLRQEHSGLMSLERWMQTKWVRAKTA